jgi:hypothetical protein
MDETDLNHDPSVATDAPEGNNTPAGSRYETLRDRFASLEAAASHTRQAANAYLASHPGRSNAYSNTSLHRQLRLLDKGELEITYGSLDCILRHISFRTTLMATATNFLFAAGIALPERRIEDFGVREFDCLMRKYPHVDRSKKYDFVTQVMFSNVLPDPEPNWEGRLWIKPHRYIAAAIAMDTTIDTVDKCDDAITRLEEGEYYLDSNARFGGVRLTEYSLCRACWFALVTRNLPLLRLKSSSWEATCWLSMVEEAQLPCCLVYSYLASGVM